MTADDMVRITRVYAPPAAEDGRRVLVDRIWPRGLSKRKAAVDVWLKEIAPSPDLRRWFHHDPARWSAFVTRYRQELDAPERAAAFARLKEMAHEPGVLTLLFGAREETYNHAALLRDLLIGKA